MPEPGTPPPEQDDDAYVASLPERARTIFEHKNSEAAARRHETREATQAAEQARAELGRERERLQAIEREKESGSERAVREAREEERQRLTAEHEAEREAQSTAHRRELARLAIKAKAANRFADPDDAVQLLPMDELLAVEDDRERDRRVDDALTKLLDSKPYLARETQPRPPLVAQGGRSERPNGRPRERSWLRG